MSGLAQKLFSETHPNALRKRFTKKNQWPLLETLTNNGYFSYSDYYLAETLLKELDEPSEDLAAFSCYLSLATRQGHMCIVIENDLLQPRPKELSMIEEEEDLDLESLEKQVLRGAKTLPETLYFTPSDINLKPFCKVEEAYYLQKYWHYETFFLEKLETIINTPSFLSPNTNDVESAIQTMIDNNRLLPEQSAAILKGCTQTFTIITGGPGTGKTYTAGHLIRIYFESLSLDDQQQCTITLAAPTGKAAANLQKSLLQSIGDNLNTKELQAKTIHSLLLDKRNKCLSPQGFLHTNLLLIDECSMIDARMMTKLFRAIRPGTKVIFLGDKFQLPPVEVGSLFADITESFKGTVCELKKCLRADMQELVDFAQEINRGDKKAVIDMLETGSSIHHLKIDDTLLPSKQQKTLLKEFLPHYKKISRETTDLLELLKTYQKYRVLTPLRKGPFGVTTLNQLIQKELSTNVMPIMITKNDYNLNLFNGEVGLLVKQHPEIQELQQGDYAAFITFDETTQKESLRKVPALLLPSYEYAYAMSIHKSQGSEFEHVCMLIPNGSEKFGREVIYTAATRAKKELTVWADEETMGKVLEKTSTRISGIKKMD